MTINLHLPTKSETLRPMITVIGVGGAGGNAVNNMIAANLEGVNFVVANTDAQALDNSLTDRSIQLGASITRGLGAGASPDVGRAAAEEAGEEIASHIEGSHMLFITAGMGGGTGTGAAPVVARLAREMGILTVGVVTKPFQFEGTHRMRIAEEGLNELQQYVDTLIIIPNQNLFRVANERTTFADAFRMADEVLHSGVRGVTDLMVKPGLVNLDFADIRAVMREMGKAMMGTGEASGERRAVESAEAAISNPLLDDVSLKGAKAVLINITGGLDMTLFEVDEAANRIREEVDPDANIIFGSTFNDAMEGKMRVSVVATGIDAQVSHQPRAAQPVQAEPRRPYHVSPMRTAEASRPALRPAQSYSAAAATSPQAKEYKPAVPQPATQAPAPAASALTQQGDFRFDAEAKAKPVPVDEEKVIFRGGKTAIGATGANAHASAPSAQSENHAGPKLFGLAQAEAQQPAHTPVHQANAQEALMPPPSAPREDAASLGFFQKVAGMGKALAARAPAPVEQYEAQPAERPRVELVEKPAPARPAEDDYFEIPAFLRRQAN